VSYVDERSVLQRETRLQSVISSADSFEVKVSLADEVGWIFRHLYRACPESAPAAPRPATGGRSEGVLVGQAQGKPI